MALNKINWNFAAALSNMEIGDSFFVPSMGDDEIQKEVIEISCRIGMKVKTKSVYNYELMGVRVWRVE